MTLAVLCPGQGGQHAAMLDILDGPALRAAGLDTAESLLDATMFDNAVAQPLICAVECAAWSMLAPRLATAGVAATVFAGYSVGELAAHACAGSLAFKDVVALARRRAAAMDAASGPGDGLVALRGVTGRVVDRLCATHGAHVAIVNGDDHWIVGGSGAALSALAAAAEATGASVHRLPVAVAAHTPLLASAIPAFRSALAEVSWTRSTDVVAGVDGSIVRDAATAVDVLSRQVAETIRWSACMDTLVERGATTMIELGPGDALSRMIRERHPQVAVRSISDFRTIDAVAAWVIGQRP